jgi:iron-sulfur cluster repair protein YtfE (RIC family)
MASSDVSIKSSSTANSSASPDRAPKPVPMAIMRNAHEVIRCALQDIQDALDKDDFDRARDMWHRFHRFSDMHMKMEEGRKGANSAGLFAMIDKHGNQAVRKAGLRHHHERLYELEEDVVDIFENAPDVDRAKEVFPIFRQEDEDHLKEEEDILMPAIQEMIKNGVPLKKCIQSEIIPLLLEKEGDMEFFIRFSNEVLERHDKVNGKPRVRVWNQAIWSLATAEQWKEWRSWIEDTLTGEKYAEVDEAIQAFMAEQKAKKGAKKEEETPPMPTKIDVKKKEIGVTRFFKKIFGSTSA